MSNPNRKWQALDESIETALADICWRCAPGTFNILDRATAQKTICRCAESCGFKFCAGEPRVDATALEAEEGSRYCTECGNRLSEPEGTLSGLCPECEAENVWGR